MLFNRGKAMRLSVIQREHMLLKPMLSIFERARGRWQSRGSPIARLDFGSTIQAQDVP